MRCRQQGTTDLKVSAVCLGCWGILGGWNRGPQDGADPVAALAAATMPVKDRLGANCDQWQVPGRMERA